jgi:hypothetical protein
MATTAVGKDVTLEEVLLHVKALEERVAALERITGQTAQLAAASQGSEVGATESLASPLQSGLSFTGGNFASVAKALLGFAGAYLLRAAAESGSVSQSIGILAGLTYSVFWLLWAIHSGGTDSFSATLSALTSAGILGGLVWENAVQTHALPLPLAASLITLFAYTGMFLAARRTLPRIAAIVIAMSSSLALALLLATHDVIPMTVAALSIAAASELAACSGRWLRQRWFPALAADLAVLIVAWVITQPQGIPESYRPFAMSTVVGLQISLVLIYMLGTAYRTLVTGSDITHFEIAQNMAGIALFIWASVVMGREAPAARVFVAAFCVLAGLGCYAIAVLFLARQSRQRNFLMYGIFGLSLEMAGISILFSGPSLVFVWCTLAGVVSWLGTKEHRISLQLQTPVLLGAAAVGSGLIEFARHALHNATAPDPSRLLEIVAVTVALGFCYWMAGSGENGKARVPAFLIAALLCWAILGLGGAGITTVLGPGSAMSSTLRNGLICALALGLAKPGTRRPELIWLVYPLMLYGAYRLVAEDFTHSQTTALALSLLFYGGTLLQLTRMIREDKAST